MERCFLLVLAPFAPIFLRNVSPLQVGFYGDGLLASTPQEVLDFVRNSQAPNTLPERLITSLHVRLPFLLVLHFHKPITRFTCISSTLCPRPKHLIFH